MPTEPSTRRDAVGMAPADRIGFARLTKQAFDGFSLLPLWQELMTRIDQGTADAGDGLDLALITQLLGEKQAGLAIQTEILAKHRLFRSPCASDAPKLRVLALAADIDMGGNTPIEFLLENSGIELTTLYVIPGTELPNPLPAHDVAIVVASDSEECRGALADIERLAPNWPVPLLNAPRLIGNLDRDKLYRVLSDVEGLDIPATISINRRELTAVAESGTALADIAEGTDFPIIIRPRGSHAGHGLAKIEDKAALARYLTERHDNDFFVSRFIDYSADDGLFRKYRLVVIDGKPYACHMAIADQWNIWYLNAGMAASESKQLEEAAFFQNFDTSFAMRHRGALAGMIERVGLDYFLVDCAEDKNGDLLVFEIDNTAVVHNMDSAEIYPYKPPQMNKIFDAFAAMLMRRASHALRGAA